MDEDLMRTSIAMDRLTRAQQEENRRMRAALDWLVKDMPPAPPLTLRRRFALWWDDVRDRTAEIVRRVADWIDPYA